MKKRLNHDDILAELRRLVPGDAAASVDVRDLDACTVHIQLSWSGGGATLFLQPDDLHELAALFALRWIAPALEDLESPLLCLSCGAEKRPGLDLPCGH